MRCNGPPCVCAGDTWREQEANRHAEQLEEDKSALMSRLLARVDMALSEKEEAVVSEKKKDKALRQARFSLGVCPVRGSGWRLDTSCGRQGARAPRLL